MKYSQTEFDRLHGWCGNALKRGLTVFAVALALAGCANSPRGIKVVASSASMTTVGDINWDEYKIPVMSIISGPRSTVWVNKDYLAIESVKAGGCVSNDTSILAIYDDKSGRENFIELKFKPTYTNACPCVTNAVESVK